MVERNASTGRILRPMLVVLLAVVTFGLPVFPQATISFERLPTTVIDHRLQLVPSDNESRKEMLEDLFEESGCNAPQLVFQDVKRSKLPNVVCTLPGTAESTIIVGAHFDRRGAGQGVADNWSGAALLPSIYQSLKNLSLKHTFVFVGFTDEEKGRIGSKFYAKSLKEEEVALTSAMLNLDTLGLSSTKVWVSRSDPVLVTALEALAGAMQLPIDGMNMERVGSADSESFRKRDIPSMTIHSVTQENLTLLHSRADNLYAIQSEEYYRTYRLISAYLVYLDNVLD